MLRFRARLLWLRARYRFSTLRLERVGHNYFIEARMNPGDRRRVDGHIVDKNLVPFPIGENSATSEKDFAYSRSGKVHLYLFKPNAHGAKAYIWRANRNSWERLPEPRSGGEAERLARERLAAEKENFIALVPPDRHPSAPGLDVAGIGEDRQTGEDRITFGEAKESTAGRRFTVRDVTAIRGPTLRRNIRDVTDRALREHGQAALVRVESALREGRIDFQIYLRGSAQYSALQLRKLERLIKITLRAYLRSRGLSRADVDRAIQNIRVPMPITVG